MMRVLALLLGKRRPFFRVLASEEKKTQSYNKLIFCSGLTLPECVQFL